MALLRAPHWRRCLAAASGPPAWVQLSTSAARATGAGKDPFADMQDPSKTHPAYSSDPASQRVPGPEDEGVEQEVKLGKNIPASAEQAVEEAKYAGKGLAESVEKAAGVLLSKAKDAAAAASRAVGLGSDHPQMSKGGMGAAGQMEYGSSTGSGSASSSESAKAKYAEMAETEKPNFPEGERSVNELFPEMKTAASEQSNTPERQMEENEAIRRELHKPS